MSGVEKLWRRQRLGMELSRKMGGFGMKMEISVVVLLGCRFSRRIEKRILVEEGKRGDISDQTEMEGNIGFHTIVTNGIIVRFDVL
jgi:hypothetical protein